MGIENMRDFRRMKDALAALPAAERAAHPLSADQFGDVFLVIDGWLAFREEFDNIETMVHAIAAQGLSYGVHVILAASRWGEIRPVIKDHLGTRLELRLGDPMDSEMDRRTAVLVPMGRPGRGLTSDKLHMLMALPRLDSDSDPVTLSEGVARAKEQMSALYGDRRAPDVRMLLAQMPRERVMEQARAAGVQLDGTHLCIGVGESELEPMVLDFDSQPHLLVLADVECGKTTVLRNIVMGIAEQAGPRQARIILVDYRRTMLGVIEGDQLAGYSTSSQTSGGMLKEVAMYMSKRIPGPDITPQELRERSWWTGPDIYVIVDDYDMVSGAKNPLVALLEYLPQARDIGLHVIIARRSGGVARALFDPVLGPMKDMSVDVLLMSASKDEGSLFGVKPMKMPPGRGMFLSRSRDKEMVQISYLPPL
jgi:S-DNA-T family DNA segregation ATPase FtsK/SpoIIIE